MHRRSVCGRTVRVGHRRIDLVGPGRGFPEGAGGLRDFGAVHQDGGVRQRGALGGARLDLDGHVAGHFRAVDGLRDAHLRLARRAGGARRHRRGRARGEGAGGGRAGGALLTVTCAVALASRAPEASSTSATTACGPSATEVVSQRAFTLKDGSLANATPSREMRSAPAPAEVVPEAAIVIVPKGVAPPAGEAMWAVPDPRAMETWPCALPVVAPACVAVTA